MLQFLKKNSISIPIFLFGLLLFFACKKDKNVTTVDIGYEYFPIKTGNYIIYQVDSLYYNDFTSTIDTFQFQIKEKVAAIFEDLSQRPTQRIERYYRKNNNENWMFIRVWYTNRTATTAEKVEENLRYVKLVFPIKKNNTWNGNLFNNLKEQNYTLTKVNEAWQVDDLKFDSIVYIQQIADSNLIEKKIGYEIYAKNIGMIFKKQLNLTDKDTLINYTIPFEERANSGFDLTYKVISFGVE